MEPFFQTTDGTIRTYVGDALAVLREMPADSVHCCVTSPPYYGLRDYGVDGQIGLEDTPAAFVARLVEVFAEVRRVLHPSGVCWVNMGDSYAATTKGSSGKGDKQLTNKGTLIEDRRWRIPDSCKPKDLIGVPWMLAFALRDDGWYLRQEIIWHKPAPMPESVTDRCTKAHEQVFLLANNERYFYDAEAIKVAAAYPNDKRRPLGSEGAWEMDGRERGENGGGKPYDHYTSKSNRRSVWTVASEPFPGSHFATFPSELIRPMIRAGSSERGCCPACLAPWRRVTEKGQYSKQGPSKRKDAANNPHNHTTANSITQLVGGGFVPVFTRGWQPTCECNAGDPVPCTILDPFGGSGTTGMVARQEGRACVMIELNPEYAAMHRARVMQVKAMADEDAPLFGLTSSSAAETLPPVQSPLPACGE